MKKLILNVIFIYGLAGMILCTSAPAGQSQDEPTGKTQVAARTLLVPQEYLTIQSAINAARDGDTVLVDAGVYYENIDFLGKDITVSSVSGPAVTVIDGGYNDVVVRFEAGESRNAVLKGFEIRHGYSSSGGGIYCFDSSPTITGNVIQHNSASIDGGGISVVGATSSPAIENNIITENEARGQSGGAIFVGSDYAPLIRNNLITHNKAERHGDSIYVFYYSPANIINNTITENFGPLSVYLSTINVVNTILWDNGDRGEIENVFGSSEVNISYSDIKGGWEGTGNIDRNPRFTMNNGSTRDYYSLNHFSPAIDAGNSVEAPATDIDGQWRYDDQNVEDTGFGNLRYVDMGAYERQTDSKNSPIKWKMIVE